LLERLIDGQPTDPGRRHPRAPGLDPTGQLLTVVGTIQQTPLAVGDALQLARDTLEQNMSLGTARPLAAIRYGELVLYHHRNLAAHQGREPSGGTPTNHR